MELRSGELLLWDRRVHCLEELTGDRARIRDTNSADLREVLVSELRGQPSLTIVELDQRVERLRTIETPDWSKAQRRETVIREALHGDGRTTELVEAAAGTLGLSTRTVRRLITRYTASAQTTSLLAHLRGPEKSRRRLGHSSCCFGFVKSCVEKKIRRHLMRARKRRGYGWERWTSQWLYVNLGLFDGYHLRTDLRYASSTAKSHNRRPEANR